MPYAELCSGPKLWFHGLSTVISLGHMGATVSTGSSVTRSHCKMVFFPIFSSSLQGETLSRRDGQGSCLNQELKLSGTKNQARRKILFFSLSSPEVWWQGGTWENFHLLQLDWVPLTILHGCILKNWVLISLNQFCICWFHTFRKKKKKKKREVPR